MQNAANGQYQSGPKHPRYQSDEVLIERICTTLKRPLYATGKLEVRPRSRRYAEIACENCGRTNYRLVDNILGQKSKRCQCQGWKYDNKERAKTFGERYDAMVQRCNTDTHVSSSDYHGRGIKVLFKSRQEFVSWALQKWPREDLSVLDIDRINNDGHYEKGNLRLATRSMNILNQRPRKRRYMSITR